MSERPDVFTSRIAVSYERFFVDYRGLTRSATLGGRDEIPTVTESELGPQTYAELARLADRALTSEVLEPLRLLVEHTGEVVRTANEESRATAHHLRIGFLLLGICGAAAGLLTGMGIARAFWRSIVQFDVSIRGAVGILERALP